MFHLENSLLILHDKSPDILVICLPLRVMQVPLCVTRLSVSVLDCALFLGAAFASQMHVVECQSSCVMQMENLELVEHQIIRW